MEETGVKKLMRHIIEEPNQPKITATAVTEDFVTVRRTVRSGEAARYCPKGFAREVREPGKFDTGAPTAVAEYGARRLQSKVNQRIRRADLNESN